jgi:hypothetical protein
MAYNVVVTPDGKKTMIYRFGTSNSSLSSTQYLPPSKYRIGVNQADVGSTSSLLSVPIPITHGTVCDDGDNLLTGASGGTNTTDNTTTFKEGAGVTDATAQNLIANSTNATKQWYKTSLDTNVDDTQYIGYWLYIKDAATLAKFTSAGVTARFGSDASNYYSLTYAASTLTVGWNWLYSTDVVSTLTATGTPGTLSRFDIIITTNNATDTFASGDVIYDLLRQWEDSDLISTFTSGFPAIDISGYQVNIQTVLTTIDANGFLINGLQLRNEDTSPLNQVLGKFASESKSSTDELRFSVGIRVNP